MNLGARYPGKESITRGTVSAVGNGGFVGVFFEHAKPPLGDACEQGKVPVFGRRGLGVNGGSGSLPCQGEVGGLSGQTLERRGGKGTWAWLF